MIRCSGIRNETDRDSWAGLELGRAFLSLVTAEQDKAAAKPKEEIAAARDALRTAVGRKILAESGCGCVNKTRETPKWWRAEYGVGANGGRCKSLAFPVPKAYLSAPASSSAVQWSPSFSAPDH